MSGNLINDGDFESGQGQWSFTSNGSGVTTETETIDNGYCRIATTESVYQNVALSAESSYNVAFVTRGELSGVVSIMLVNSNTTYWSAPYNSARNTGWTLETHSFLVDSAWVGPFIIHFTADYDADSSKTVDIDDILLVQA